MSYFKKVELAQTFSICTDLGGCQYSQSDLVQVPFKYICKVVEEWHHGYFCLGYFFSSNQPFSTSLIHNMASDGQSEQVVTWFLNRIFQTKKDCGVGKLSICSSEVRCLCCPTIEFCGKATGIVELSRRLLQMSALKLCSLL